jgi:Na+-driven multidrug efflux pump
VFGFIYVLLTRTTTQFGTPALAALGLGFRVESIVYVVSVGAGAAVAAIVGQSLGAGDVDRARRAGWSAVSLVSVLGGMMALVTVAIPETLAGVFSTDTAVVAEAAHYLRIAAFCQLFLGAEVVRRVPWVALDGRWHPCSAVPRSLRCVFRWAPTASQFGTTGLWWTLALTAAARGILMAALWKSGRWRRVAV